MHPDQAARLLASPVGEDWIRAAIIGEPADRGIVRVELDRVHHRPGADTSAGFHVTVADGSATEYVVATTADIPVGDDVAEVHHDGIALRFWRHPADPRLPWLGDACDPKVVAAWLGVDAVDLDLISYRPLRRAIIRARTDQQTYYARVIAEDRWASQIERHRVMAAAGIGPELLAEPAPGVMILRAADGEPLAERFAAVARGETPPAPGDLTELLDRLPEELLRLPRRSAWSQRLDFHLAAAVTTLPEAAEELRQLTADIQRVIADRPAGPVVPVHGDLYEANIFVTGKATPRYTLIDLDTAGPGHRVDDLACVLAHLAVLPDLSPPHYSGLIEVVEQWRAHFETQVDPVALRARVAAVILTLIAGTSRAHALTRLDLVRSWLHRAGN